MTDTVTRLIGMIDEYAMRCSTAHVSIEPARQALQDELVRLFTPLNQCDGCMAGQVMRGALHIGDDGKPLMVCQKSKYEAENEANERNLCQLTDDLAESRREVAQLQEQNTYLDKVASELHIDLIEGAVNKLQDENKKLRQDIDSLAEINYQLAQKMKEERQRKRPLSDEQIESLVTWEGDKNDPHYNRIRHGRSIEKAHGIGEAK